MRAWLIFVCVIKSIRSAIDADKQMHKINAILKLKKRMDKVARDNDIVLKWKLEDK